MSTSSPSAPAKTPAASSASFSTEWASLVPKVTAADTLDPVETTKAWQRMYSAAHVKGEDAQRSLRMAVYVNGLLNGTSREGDYQNMMELSTGDKVPASVIPTSVGKMHIRKFYRANMDESYVALKSIDMGVSFPRVVAKAAELGIAANEAFAMADWLTDCPGFTPSEAKAHNKQFTSSVDRSRRARGGVSLEEVEDKRMRENLRAQGPSSVDEGTPFSF